MGLSVMRLQVVARESAESHLRHALQLLGFRRYRVGGGDVEVQGVDGHLLDDAALLEQVRVRVSLALVEITKGEVI